ncbi:hypothetical protein AOL_s00054g347 [Orbilia oligospora ATCC 24927]|uniref:C2 NT-type domain-containing protein n=1 Tax=Arthrobotrys oligospora (strain ATCC 24927 / CBS 115.81 / DSM 1491) TaxID=756982 RepID=G1X653_ARTOA|nr:hypothetical protein AOL_s00054g347 [Orbilia oligospora ATCC 24927]EGX51277.1 hypothetical protein AOL_s00054g347 [Orbilia oligospora ATCC 24927]
MHSFVVPKSRRPRFNLKLQVHDLNNVPLVSGLAYVKWHIRDSPLAESRGRTSKIPIKEHRVTWRYTKELVIKMTVDRGGMLSPVYLDLEIIQEYSGRERIILGTLELNLAEYVGRERESRRYLMQASKINSTVQISTEIKQISGDMSFKVPELRPAQVFSGIAGVVMSEPTISEPVDPNSTSAAENPYGAEMTNMPAHSRERDRAHDIYRKSLAASWQLQTGELNAVDCIEDIFAGGTGWAQDPGRQTATDDIVNCNSNPDDSETRSSHQDLHPSAHRGSSHKLTSGWHHNDSWKRARSFQFERQDSSASSRPSPRIPLKADSFRSTSSLRPHAVSRAVSPNDSGSSQTINISQDRASNVSQHHGWHSLEVAEEDLRDNLTSWSL